MGTDTVLYQNHAAIGVQTSKPTVTSGAQDYRKIPNGRNAGFQSGDTDLPCGGQCKKQGFKNHIKFYRSPFRANVRGGRSEINITPNPRTR